MTADGVPAAEASSATDAVDAARARLATLDDVPVAQHPAVFEDVHAALQTTLAGLDER